MLKVQRSRRCCPLSFCVSKVQPSKINFEKGIKEIIRQIHTPNVVRSKSDIKSFQFSQTIWCSYSMRQIRFVSFLSRLATFQYTILVDVA